MTAVVVAPTRTDDEHVVTPIDVFLGRQQSMTAVERFAAHHADAPGPAETGRWQDRLPATPPGPGQQYAFEVDLDTCTGCKACVAACHSLNGLDDGEAWRRVGSLHATTAAHAGGVHTVTSACHHCVDPACLTGCPANAYEKDPISGIVAHLDDDCIGCSYCTLTCPYEVPTFNPSLGIVRKCDMCSDRLAEGEAPACVQGCPQGAITIGLVSVAEVVAESDADETLALVPGAPRSSITGPTTRYHSSRPLDPTLVAADARSAHPAHEHTPLAIMLVLTQAAVGMLAVAAGLRWAGDIDATTTASLSTLVLGTGLIALGASVFHLGRPLLAWRAVLGIGHSWLSREIVAFGCFAAAAVADSLLVHSGASAGITDLSLAATVLAGLAGVACSAQLYAATRRTWWRWSVTGPRFVVTMAVGGALGTAAVLAFTADDPTTGSIGTLLLVAALAGPVGLVLVLLPLRTRARRSAARGPRRHRPPAHRPAAADRRAPPLVPAGWHRPPPDRGGVPAGIPAGRGRAGAHRRLGRGPARRVPRAPPVLRRLCRPPHAGPGPMTPSGRLADRLARVPAGFGIGQVPADHAPTATTRLVCGYCSTGCSLDVHLRDGIAVGLTPSPEHPVNRGAACPKGWEALAPLAAPDRATSPLLRDDHGHLQPVDWSTALTTFCDRMKAVQAEHGPESVAFLSTGQIPTEEMALLGALAKFGMGIKHGDGNTRQCMASSVVAYKEAFGFDAPPYTYDDFETSDVIVLLGSNLCVAHPIMWERITANPNRPEIIVIDPRRTETAMVATQHLALRPKSDLALLYGLANLLIERDAVDHEFVWAHTNGFTEFVSFVADFTLERVVAETGLPAEQLHRLADTIAAGRAVSFWWTMGVNQSHQGVRTGQAIIDLALLTGNIGRPGTGANSITGQCNAMGSRLFSNTTSLLGGHDFADADHRQKVAETLGIDVAAIPTEPSWSYDRIIEGISTGKIKALWVIATNGAHSWINHSDLHWLLGELDFLVVQDLYPTTETAQRADLVLPAAGWGEKEGSFINSERRLGLVKRVSPAPGDALADFYIFKAIADAWGCGHLFSEWTDPEATFRILQRLSAGRPCDLTGVDGYEQIDRGEVQWPYRPGDRPVGGEPAELHRRLFADGRFYTPDGRARFVFEEPVAPPEQPGTRYPLVLNTGRGSASQWHTETRTGKSATLRALAPDGLWIEIHPDDAEVRGLETGDAVIIESARGSVDARAHVVSSVQPGQTFVPMHHPEVNRLTYPAFDPYSRQPSYKYSAVQVRRAAAWEPAHT